MFYLDAESKFCYLENNIMLMNIIIFILIKIIIFIPATEVNIFHYTYYFGNLFTTDFHCNTTNLVQKPVATILYMKALQPSLFNVEHSLL